MGSQYLPEFQNFLITRKFALEKNAPFYAYWAAKFLEFSNKNEDFALDIRKDKFLKELASDKVVAEQNKFKEKSCLI
ncbi:MAG: hypothetical protein ABH914_04390 [Candidatus Omnitrophota bacterium]